MSSGCSRSIYARWASCPLALAAQGRDMHSVAAKGGACRWSACRRDLRRPGLTTHAAMGCLQRAVGYSPNALHVCPLLG